MKIIVPIHLEIGKKKKKTIPLSLNWYRNAYFYEQNEVKKMIKEIVRKQITKERFETFMTTLQFNYSRADQDLDNFTSIAKKFVLDALTEYGVIPDDSINYHTETHAVVGERNKEGNIIFEIL